MHHHKSLLYSVLLVMAVLVVTTAKRSEFLNTSSELDLDWDNDDGGLDLEFSFPESRHSRPKGSKGVVHDNQTTKVLTGRGRGRVKDDYGTHIIFGWGGESGGGGWDRKGWGKGYGKQPRPVPAPPPKPAPPGPAPGPAAPPPPPPIRPIIFCAVGEKCLHFVHCASHSQKFLKQRERCCHLTYEAKGMCCPALPFSHGVGGGGSSTGTERVPVGNHFPPYSTAVVKIHPISSDSLQHAAEKAVDYKTDYYNLETRILELGLVVKEGTAAYGHAQFFQTTPAILNVAVENLCVLKATGYLQDKFFLTSAQAGVGLQVYGFGGTRLGTGCPISPSCNEYARKYRTADGSCNNFNIPKLGQSGTPLLRLLPPDYADGIWAPRVRHDGGPLPPPRLITRNLVPDTDAPDLRYSHLVMQFGQFIDHDLTHVPIFRLRDLSAIDCCPSGGGIGGGGGYGRRKRHLEEDTETIQHPACFPIALDPNDPKFGGRTCMNFVRSLVAPRLECTFGHADQLNQVTHWLDASQIYGSTYERMAELREFNSGLLRVTRDPSGRQLLPLDHNDREDCVGSANSRGGSAGLHCFIAGDRRVNEQLGIATVQTLWLREHNRIARSLQALHSDWDDEILYQETRRIVVAEYQHIIYNEWLPIVIGRKYMTVFDILPHAEGYYTGHDVSTEPTVSNAFATAAFRLHTLVSGWFDLNDEGRNTVSRLTLRDFFNNPHVLREPATVDGLAKGLLTQPVQRFDPYVTTELRDHLFETGTRDGIGMDLPAINIQRGRDHGLPSYNEYRDLCRLGKARTFAELSPIIPRYKADHLAQIYESVDDIDLWIGGIHESPAEGALVGPTFLCIIGDQFARLKKSDRYFYDVGGTPHSFNTAQLATIRRVSMARIICDNTEEIRSIQPLAFHLPNDGYNPVMPCGSPAIPTLDLGAWA